MVNLSFILRQRWRGCQPAFSVLDLKAHFRALKYVTETLKLLPQSTDPFLIHAISENSPVSVRFMLLDGDGIGMNGFYYLVCTNGR